MTTINELIEDSLIDLGRLSLTEDINPEDLKHGLRVANRLFGEWAAENLLIACNASTSFSTTTGTAQYSASSGGSVGWRPLRLVDSCYIRNSSGYDYPLRLITMDEYNGIYDKDLGGRPHLIAYDPEYTTGYIYLYKTPDSASYTVYIEGIRYLHATVSADTTLSMPVQYENFIVLGLRNRLAGSFGIPVTPDMRMEYAKAEQVIKNMNFANRVNMSMDFPPGFGGKGSYDTIENC